MDRAVLLTVNSTANHSGWRRCGQTSYTLHAELIPAAEFQEFGLLERGQLSYLTDPDHGWVTIS
jgi:hypothetical protein